MTEALAVIGLFFEEKELEYQQSASALREMGDNDNGGTVTIPVFIYESLCDARQQVQRLEAIGLLDQRNELGLFSHDPEVAVFIAARHGLMTASEVAKAVSNVFGYDRKPDIPTVRRFWLRFANCFEFDE